MKEEARRSEKASSWRIKRGAIIKAAKQHRKAKAEQAAVINGELKGERHNIEGVVAYGVIGKYRWQMAKQLASNTQSIGSVSAKIIGRRNLSSIAAQAYRVNGEEHQ